MLASDYIIILFYSFIPVADPQATAEAHRRICTKLGLTGRMIVAEEGVNATFEGTREAVESYKVFAKNDPALAGVIIKESAGTGKAFPKLKIKVRDEIVTLGAGKFDVARETATQLPAEELQKWYEQGEDFVVLDLRNDYEIMSGQFERTVDPGLSNFRDLPSKAKALASQLKGKKVVAVCTGGIRCEKATCLLKKEGFTDIYQLKDGIHTYMQQYPGSHFKGTLFVFDNRMTTDVVPIEKKDIIGSCTFCGVSTEQYCADDSVRPSRKLLCCASCLAAQGTPFRSTAQ